VMVVPRDPAFAIQPHEFWGTYVPLGD
jgi:hypothetical protein